MQRTMEDSDEAYRAWRKCIRKAGGTDFIPYISYISSDKCVKEYDLYMKILKEERLSKHVP